MLLLMLMMMMLLLLLLLCRHGTAVVHGVIGSVLTGSLHLHWLQVDLRYATAVNNMVQSVDFRQYLMAKTVYMHSAGAFGPKSRQNKSENGVE